MSIVDSKGRPVAHEWNDEAAAERCKKEHGLRQIPDEEFERQFPFLFQNTASKEGG